MKRFHSRMTRRQKEFIQTGYDSGDWPGIGGSQEAKAAGKEIRERLLRELATMGPPLAWMTCLNYVSVNSPAKLREKAVT